MGEPIPDIIQIYNSIYYNITIYNSNNCITVYTTAYRNNLVYPYISCIKKEIYKQCLLMCHTFIGSA